MPLETGTYISDLVATNPVGASDQKAQGDDHIRLLKSAILATFPNITGAVTPTHTQINQLTSLAAVSVLGRSANSSGAPAAIAAGANDRILRRVSDAIDFGQLTAGMFPNTVVPDAALSSNVPLRSAANTFMATQTLDGAFNWFADQAGGGGFGWSDDTNTYIWSSAADTINIVTGGANRALFSSAEIDLTAALLDFNGQVKIGGSGITQNPLQIIASDSVGDCYMSFYAADESTRKGYFGYGNAGDNSFIFSNESAGAGLFLYTSNGELAYSGDDGSTLPFRVSPAGVVTTLNQNASEAGYKGAPQNAQDGNYTLVLTDAGKTIYKASGGAGETITIPANGSVAFPVGTIIEIANDGGGDLSIAITTDTLEQWGTGATGTRTLADNGKAIIEKVASTTWKISGIGLS